MALQNSPPGRLPVELRLKIYGSLLTFNGHLRRRIANRKKEACADTSLLLTCKLIKDEAIPELYSTNIFALTPKDVSSLGQFPFADQLTKIDMINYKYNPSNELSTRSLLAGLSNLESRCPKLKQLNCELRGYLGAANEGTLALESVGIGRYEARCTYVSNGTPLSLRLGYKMNVRCSPVQEVWQQITATKGTMLKH